MMLPVLQDKVTIPSHRNVLLFHKATAPPGAWSKAMQGTSPRSKKPFLGPGIWGHLFWSLLRRAYQAPVSRLRELKHEPTPESLTHYIKSFVHSGAGGKINCPMSS
jgi:hypothetical protein